MGHHRVTSRTGTALGWLSVGLGAGQLLTPDAMAAAVGLSPTTATRRAMRTVALQELTVGAGLLRGSRPAPWLWARVAGDLGHLTALGLAPRPARADGPRRRGSLALVGIVTVVDAIAAIRASRRSESEPLRSRASITVNRPPAEVYEHWRNLENLPRFMFHLESVEQIGPDRSRWVARAPAGGQVDWEAEIVRDVPAEQLAWRSVEGSRIDNSGVVGFRPAPGGRGTEVTVDLEYRIPGGRAGAAVARLFGEEPEQQARDDLRRFKQVLETGQVVISDATPDGTRTSRQVLQRAARPAP